MEDEVIFDEFYKFADTVIYIEEVDPEKESKEECFKLTMKNVDSFFSQVDKNLSLCESDEDRDFSKEVTLNFLIFSLKKLIVDYDAPDENIDMLANHLKNQILQCKRKK